MKKLIFSGIAALLLFASSHLSAADVWHISTLSMVYPQGDGSFIIGFAQNAAGCPNVESPTKYMRVASGQNGVTADAVKNFLATALLAYANSEQVTVSFDNSTAFCYVGVVLVKK